MNNTYIDFAEKNSDLCQEEIIKHVIRDTYVNVLYPQMLTYPLQAGLLRAFSLMIKPECIFEIGTFTGMGTICLAEGLQENGTIYTFEKNEELEERILKNFEIAGINKKAKIIFGEAKKTLQTIDKKPDLIYIDADKENYADYFRLLFPRLKEGGWIIADNVWWDGKVIEKSTKPSKETKGIVDFLELCQQEKTASRLFLPLFDGLMIIQKQSQ